MASIPGRVDTSPLMGPRGRLGTRRVGPGTQARGCGDHAIASARARTQTMRTRIEELDRRLGVRLTPSPRLNPGDCARRMVKRVRLFWRDAPGDGIEFPRQPEWWLRPHAQRQWGPNTPQGQPLVGLVQLELLLRHLPRLSPWELFPRRWHLENPKNPSLQKSRTLWQTDPLPSRARRPRPARWARAIARSRRARQGSLVLPPRRPAHRPADAVEGGADWPPTLAVTIGW